MVTHGKEQEEATTKKNMILSVLWYVMFDAFDAFLYHDELYKHSHTLTHSHLSHLNWLTYTIRHACASSTPHTHTHTERYVYIARGKIEFMNFAHEIMFGKWQRKIFFLNDLQSKSFFIGIFKTNKSNFEIQIEKRNSIRCKLISVYSARMYWSPLWWLTEIFSVKIWRINMNWTETTIFNDIRDFGEKEVGHNRCAFAISCVYCET